MWRFVSSHINLTNFNSDFKSFKINFCLKIFSEKFLKNFISPSTTDLAVDLVIVTIEHAREVTVAAAVARHHQSVIEALDALAADLVHHVQRVHVTTIHACRSRRVVTTEATQDHAARAFARNQTVLVRNRTHTHAHAAKAVIHVQEMAMIKLYELLFFLFFAKTAFFCTLAPKLFTFFFRMTNRVDHRFTIK